MVVLASITDSMVVDKRDVSSFRDVEIAAVPHGYRACMAWGGGGGGGETNNAKSAHKSLFAAWLNTQDLHGRRGCTFTGRIRATEQKQTKK